MEFSYTTDPQPDIINGSSTTNKDYVLSLKICVGLVCCLSTLGSLLIIITFIAYKDVRTIPRQLLFNLSIADLITAVGNLVGIAVDFDGVVGNVNSTSTPLTRLCTAQAFFSQLGTNSSIYWTIAVAVYMFMVVVMNKGDLATKLLPVYYIVCWGLPTAIMTWFVMVGYLGYKEGTTPGWCDISNTHTVLPITVGYTLNVYIAFIVLPVLYIWIRCHVKILIKKYNGQVSLQLKSIAKSTDLKLIFVPLIFMFIRVWGISVDAIKFYADKTVSDKFSTEYVGMMLIMFKGLGDSSQGFFNCILFIGFTETIRTKLWRLIKKLTTCRCLPKQARRYLLESVTESNSNPLLRGELGQSTSYSSTNYTTVTDGSYYNSRGVN